MSKISQLHAELSEQAYELGFESLGEAEQAGYGVDWENAKLIKIDDEQEQAHQAWLKERDILCHELEMLVSDTPYQVYKETLIKAVNFLRKECHD